MPRRRSPRSSSASLRRARPAPERGLTTTETRVATQSARTLEAAPAATPAALGERDRERGAALGQMADAARTKPSTPDLLHLGRAGKAGEKIAGGRHEQAGGRKMGTGAPRVATAASVSESVA